MPKDQLPEKSVASNSEIITSLSRQADPITTLQSFDDESHGCSSDETCSKCFPVLGHYKVQFEQLVLRDLLAKLVNPGILIQSGWIHNPTEISVLKTLSLEATFLMLWATTCFVVGLSVQSFIYRRIGLLGACA